MPKIKEAVELKKRLAAENPKCDDDTLYRLYMEKAGDLARFSKDPHAEISRYFQLYNYDKRRALNAKKQAHLRIEAEEIAIVTQFFTPAYITKYIIDNSLGKLLFEGGLDLKLPFFDPVDPGALGRKPLPDITGLRIIDPACGTGNLLAYAAEVLFAAYRKSGFRESEIAPLVSKNLFGLEIDPRAAELCKKVLFERFAITPEIYVWTAPSPRFIDLLVRRGEQEVKKILFELPSLGSIARLPDIPSDIKDRILAVAPAFGVLDKPFDVILINPPYLASSDYGRALKNYIESAYKSFGADLFSVFVARFRELLKSSGYLGVVCPYNWMYLKRFAKLRKTVIDKHDIVNLAQLSVSGYKEAVVYLSCFVMRAKLEEGRGSYIMIKDSEGEEEALRAACGNPSCAYRYVVEQAEFERAPNGAILFWANEKFFENYKRGRLGDYMDIRQGLATGDNKKYLRKITEVSEEEIDFTAESEEEFDDGGKKYALYTKGGKFRKWYGNLDYVIRFDRSAREELKTRGNRLPSRRYYFRTGITWTLVSSRGVFGARLTERSVFDVGGSCGFPKQAEDNYVILGYLCSKVANAYIYAQNPTINCQVGDLKKIPYIPPAEPVRSRIEALVRENVAIARKDWLASAKSYLPAEKRPLITEEERKNNELTLLNNETELNRIFIDIYGLSDTLSPEADASEITLELRPR